MVPGNIPAKVSYTGNNTTAQYDYPFRAEDITDIEIAIVEDATGTEEVFEGGVSDRFSASHKFWPLEGGYVLLNSFTPDPGELEYLDVDGFLKAGFSIYIMYRADARQTIRYRDTSNMTPSNVEKGLDRLTMAVKAAIELGKQALRLQNGEAGNPVFPPLLGNEDRGVYVNSDATGFVYGPTVSQIQGMVDAAQAAQDAAETAQTAAEAAQTGAEDAQTAAESAKTAAEAAQTAAEAAQTAAETAEDNAANSADQAAIEANLNNYSTVVDLDFSASPYSVTNADKGKLFRVDTTSGNFVFNMPAIGTVDPDFKIGAIKTMDDLHTVSVVRNGTNTINGGTSYSVAYQDLGIVIRPVVPGINWTAKTFVNTSADGGGGGGGASGFDIDSVTQDVADGATIDLIASKQQVLKVVGDSAVTTASTTPFSTNADHGSIIVIQGTDSTDYVVFPVADVDYGIIAPADFYATKDATMTLYADMVRKRYVQQARTDMP